MITYSKVVPEEVLASIAEDKDLHTTEQRYRAVEQATIAALMAELAEQEPVAWIGLDTATGRTYLLEDREDMLDTAKIERFKVTPLYTHPMPCVSPTNGKTDDTAAGTR